MAAFDGCAEIWWPVVSASPVRPSTDLMLSALQLPSQFSVLLHTRALVPRIDWLAALAFHFWWAWSLISACR